MKIPKLIVNSIFLTQKSQGEKHKMLSFQQNKTDTYQHGSSAWSDVESYEVQTTQDRTSPPTSA